MQGCEICKHVKVAGVSCKLEGTDKEKTIISDLEIEKLLEAFGRMARGFCPHFEDKNESSF
tara:strand:- start:1154 stop:1336 length:183 start_codon:yes stop_codon:yes gene_type:complete